ncbi:hypothetical protein BDV26DRAFT_48101 [Aspergillus bertholletiae]|uniref:Uncharacterized protein n=1 Tax=Aspergillus bertholletiae TaxID=1226010 RepID=A0A5N7AWI3_9EURO|nr:hypothetical protein BDV26DRAFT_48101 [Aspergillus bertholletiae]
MGLILICFALQFFFYIYICYIYITTDTHTFQLAAVYRPCINQERQFHFLSHRDALRPGRR